MRQVSIIGDSISTFEVYNPEGYAVFYDAEMQKINEMHSVYDIWWAKVNQALHAYLCVNNAYSGSRVSGKVFPAGESRERLVNLRTREHIPNIILIYIVFNDFGTGVNVQSNLLHLKGTSSNESFEEAYDNMLKTVKSYYPEAVIVCGTLMRTKIRNNDTWKFPESFAGVKLEDYNNAIRKISKKNHCYLADIAAGGEKYETLDGTHPTAKGHETIANAWIRCLHDSAFVMKGSIK